MARLDIGQAAIAYGEVGQGQPAVLLHGSIASGGQWRGLAQALMGRFRVYTPDLHGHGGSAPWPGPGAMTLEDEAAIVAAIADRAGEPIHLVGHSYGGAVALHFAQAHPERLRSLVLIEPCAFHLLRDTGPDGAALLEQVESLAAAFIHELAMRDAAAAMARFVDFWNGNGTWWRMSPARRDAAERCAASVVAHFACTLGAGADSGACRAMSVPTLVVCGTATPSPARRLAETVACLLPRAELLRVDGAGHMAPLTHPETVNAAIAAHLDASAARGVRLRPLGPGDVAEVERHLLSLDWLDRRARFGWALGDTAVIAYARQIDPDRAVLVGAVDGPTGRIVGLAEAQPTKGPRQVELAVTVDARHRRRGHGRNLVWAAVRASFTRGAEVAEFLFAPGNRPAAGLVRALGARIDAGGLGRAEIRRAVLVILVLVLASLVAHRGLDGLAAVQMPAASAMAGLQD